jgi:5-(carboxyamino)imidazole ribonucleotide synthase
MKPRIGIFGAGQLGAYLCQAAADLGLKTSVLAFTEDSMAIEYADFSVVAEAGDRDALRQLLERSDVLTFEIEKVPLAQLELAEQIAAQGHLRIAPSAAVMRLIQNKFHQKQWLMQHGFPTAPFMDCPDGIALDGIKAELGLPFVQKTHRDGYDGQGVQVVTGADQTLWQGNAFAEQFISDRRELAILVARDTTGNIACYPVVEMEFEGAANILDVAVSPAGVSPAIAERARKLGTDIVEQLDGVGVFAIELFLTGSDEILVNEISPRVHNSGHMTLDAHVTSQYEQHLRAISGMPLGDTGQIAPAVMRNILYTDALQSDSLAMGASRWSDSTHVHWYGKSDGKPMRKMGHVTATADDLDGARRFAAEAINSLYSKTGAEA